MFITSPCEIAQDASERLSDVVLIELFYIHHRSVILSAEPLAALPHFGSADVAAVATGCFTTSAIVLPQAVFEKRLRE